MISMFNTGYDLQDQLDGVKNGIAIVSTGDTHIAITSGQYVYIQDHSTLAEGLYRATANIAANATLYSSNVTAVSGGGLNALNSKIKVNTISSTDFNTYVGNMDYVEYYKGLDISACTNIPSELTGSSHIWPFTLEIIKIQNSYAKQILHVFNNGRSNHITYVRQQTYYNGGVNWGDWNSFALNSKIANSVDVRLVTSVPFETGRFECSTAQTIDSVTIPAYSVYDCKVYNHDGVGTVIRLSTGDTWSISGTSDAWAKCKALT